MMVRSHHLWFLIINIIDTVAGGWGEFCNVGTEPPPPATVSIIVIIKNADDEISPSLHNCIDLINTVTLSDENLMMDGLARNM